MKYFTEPKGRFLISVPLEWQYKNVSVGYEEISPFSFQLYENPVGAFQISCYSKDEKPLNKKMVAQKADTTGLLFLQKRMDGGGFNIHLWYAVVEGHSFMAKYIYETGKANDPAIAVELQKSEKALSTLQLIGEDKRELAVETNKYEKFLAALGASFDMKRNAIENDSLIELLVIIANQIDAYLRMAIVMAKQLQANSNRIDIALLYQDETDAPVMERTIYRYALTLSIIDQQLFDELERLYKERNKVVHRYIITEFKTRDLFQIIHDFEIACEEVRQCLIKMEDHQFEQKIGIHGGKRNPRDEHTEFDRTLMHSWVNDKHLIRDMYHKIEAPNED